MEKIFAIFEIPGMTFKQYEKSVEDLRAVDAFETKGQLYHVAGKDENGIMTVVDVYESREALNKFSEVLIPILTKLGVTPVPPKIIPVNNIIINGTYFLKRKNVYEFK